MIRHSNDKKISEAIEGCNRLVSLVRKIKKEDNQKLNESLSPTNQGDAH